MTRDAWDKVWNAAWADYKLDNVRARIIFEEATAPAKAAYEKAKADAMTIFIRTLHEASLPGGRP
jgi:hypothetical protein